MKAAAVQMNATHEVAAGVRAADRGAMRSGGRALIVDPWGLVPAGAAA